MTPGPELLDQEIAWTQQRIDEVQARRSTWSGAEHRLKEPPAGPAGRLEAEAADRVASASRRADSAAGIEPCFGVLFLVDGSVHFVGMHGIVDAHGDVLVVDWRSQLGERFFQADHQDPRDVVVRRRIATVRGRVTGIDDDHLIAGVAPPRPLVGEGALVHEAADPSGPMRPIVATLHRAQDDAIRSKRGGLTLIGGPPGTGKTVVALNRASYLDYRGRRSVTDAWPSLYVAPSDGFAVYVAEVLPALGSAGARLITLPDLLGSLVQCVLGDTADTTRAALAGAGTQDLGRGTSRRRWRERVAKASVERARRTVLRSSDGSIHLTTSQAVAMLQRLPRSSYTTRRQWLAREIASLYGSDPDNAAIRRASNEVRDLLLPVCTPLAVAEATVEPSAEEVAPPDQRALDAATLMAAVEALGAVRVRQLVWDGPSARRRPRTVNAEAAHAQPFEFLGNSVADAIAAGLRDTEAFAARTDEIWHVHQEHEALRFGHLIVDECQDVPPEALRALTLVYGTGGRTLVGDLAQADEHGWYTNIDDLIRAGRRPADSTRHHRLSLNYRNAWGVVAAVNAVGDAIPTAEPATAVQMEQGTVRIVALGGEATERADAVAALVDAHQATVWLGDEHASAPSTAIDASAAKGLEFGSVLVVLGASLEGGAPTRQRELYVALSRAVRRLTIAAPPTGVEPLRLLLSASGMNVSDAPMT